MNRRGFLGFSLAAVGGIFIPRYDKGYRQGSGLLVASGPYSVLEFMDQWEVWTEVDRQPLVPSDDNIAIYGNRYGTIMHSATVPGIYSHARIRIEGLGSPRLIDRPLPSDYAIARFNGPFCANNQKLRFATIVR